MQKERLVRVVVLGMSMLAKLTSGWDAENAFIALLIEGRSFGKNFMEKKFHWVRIKAATVEDKNCTAPTKGLTINQHHNTGNHLSDQSYEHTR